MTADNTPPIIVQARDLDAVERVLSRVCQTQDERAALKRVLGVQDQENRVTDAFTPERPPVPEFRPQIDHHARAVAAVGRYTAWVDSHPDTDPTPIHERERVLRNAHLDLQRLEGGT